VPDGVILCDKPAGKTSHDIVAAVRRELPGKRRVGHAGTLDPFATGLLLVLVGRATRTQRYFMALPKTYAATARFGAVSSTGDPEGEIVETGTPIPEPLVLPTGEVTQRPPAYSALKVEGERAYKRARRGEEVELPERTVTVHRFEEVRREGDRVELEIECSSGTYVRTLIETLEDAYCESLRRTAIGPFQVPDGDREIPVEELMAFLPEHPLDPSEAERVGHGVAVKAGAEVADPAVRLTRKGSLIAVARPDGENLQPEVVLR
jgi:tRNA pseudouridine55 synthase